MITIRSSTSLGASVTVYGLKNSAVVQRASTDFIGLSNRWLNIAGIASFLGRRGKEIAFVQTPHIGGTLFFYEFAEDKLKRVGSLDGFSNHLIGSKEMRLSAVADINGDGRLDLALPSDDRRTLRIVGFSKGALSDLAFANLPSGIDRAIAVKGTGRRLRFVVGLENRDVYDVRR